MDQPVSPARRAAADRIVKVTVSGRVQGVGYRDFVRQNADDRSIGGWVRNLPDGQVEAILAGPGAAIDALVAMLREGPRFAVVDQVTIEDLGPDSDPGRAPFAILETRVP